MSDAVRYPDSFWSSLSQLNAFRLFVAVFLTVLAVYPKTSFFFDAEPSPWLAFLGVAYFAAGLWFGGRIRARRGGFGWLLQMQVGLDIAVIAAFTYFAGSNEIGLALILTVPMAAAGLHPQLRMVLFLPALATLAVLFMQFVMVIGGAEAADGLLRAAMLSAGFFMVSGIAHVLAKEALASARLASEKTREAAELASINAKVIQDLPNGVLVIAGDGRLMQFNQQARILLDCDLRDRADLNGCHAGLSQAWRSWRDGAGAESAILSSGEMGRRLRCRFLALGQDRAAGVVVIVEDMSELEHEATQMKLAALGRLTANLAHEIRNPLSAINQAAQLLGEDAGRDSATARLTRIIEDNVKRLNYLVEDVLSLSRRDRQNRETIRLGDYLREFVAQFEQAEMVAPGVIKLVSEGDEAILFDRMHLNQILWNLCRNASRHCSGTPGSIEIGHERAGAVVYIEIWNDGPAIPEDMRQRLFEPFFSTDRTGTGLGLHIALELAEANEGLLRCLEQARGARFRLTVKIAP